MVLALQSCLGGYAQDFHVQYLGQKHFRFFASCKSIGPVDTIFGMCQFVGQAGDGKWAGAGLERRMEDIGLF